jgi:uncharacterized protein (DUF362 family)
MRKLGSTVSLVRATDFKNLEGTISKAIDLIAFKPENPRSAIIKPNLCYYWDSSTGYTTDPQVVAAIIDLIRKTHGKIDIRVAEADASAMRTRHVFPVLGYEKMTKEKNVELINLSNDVLEDKTVGVQGREIQFKVPKSLLESDLFINVPKLKVMRATKITCAMKNIFGCIGAPKKILYHPMLNEAIVGMNKILRPQLTVVDGVTALGNHPLKLGLILAATDPFSADWVASQIMGYDPAKVEFLKIAMKEGLGTPRGITTIGESIQEFRKGFPKPSFTSSNLFWRLQFWLLKMYCKTSGDVIPPVLEEA